MAAWAFVWSKGGRLAPQELDLPSYQLHPLKDDFKWFWSVTVRANWRIIFRFAETDAFFAETDAFNVKLIDYH